MNARRNDIDWLRIFAVITLVPFHTGMIFVTWRIKYLFVKRIAPVRFLFGMKPPRR